MSRNHGPNSLKFFKITAIVPAAGRSKRTGLKGNKLFYKVAGLPLIVYTLKNLATSSAINALVVIVKNSAQVKRLRGFVNKYRLSKIKVVTLGGKYRCDSVYAGIKKITWPADYILIHDAARPFITPTLIKRCILEAVKFGAATAAIKIKSTIKSGDTKNMVKQTLYRDNLWDIQTPQVFQTRLIQQAYRKVELNQLDIQWGEAITDEAVLMEKMGKPVKLVRGSERNFKITTPQDLLIARKLIDNNHV